MSRAARVSGSFCSATWAVPTTAIGYLFGCQTKQKEVLFACLLRHLDGRAISSSDRQRAVHHEFHIAGATGFISGGRNLIRHIRRRNQVLGH